MVDAASALEGATVVVTGGSSGIGLGCAEHLAASGALVVVADVQAPPAGVPASIEFMETDVSDPAAVTTLMAQLATGEASYAVNCAGIGGPVVPLTDLANDDWERVLGVNLSGTFYALREQLRVMAPGSAVVNVASIMGLQADALASSAYVASKHGVVGLTRMAALQGGPCGIRVNAVAPGRIRTPLLESVADPATLARRAAENPMERLGEIDEVSAAIAWLLTPAAGYVNGAVLPIDGGLTAS